MTSPTPYGSYIENTPKQITVYEIPTDEPGMQALVDAFPGYLSMAAMGPTAVQGPAFPGVFGFSLVSSAPDVKYVAVSPNGIAWLLTQAALDEFWTVDV